MNYIKTKSFSIFVQQIQHSIVLGDNRKEAIAQLFAFLKNEYGMNLNKESGIYRQECDDVEGFEYVLLDDGLLFDDKVLYFNVGDTLVFVKNKDSSEFDFFIKEKV